MIFMNLLKAIRHDINPDSLSYSTKQIDGWDGGFTDQHFSILVPKEFANIHSKVAFDIDLRETCLKVVSSPPKS